MRDQSDDLLWRHLKDLPYFRATLRAVEARIMAQVELPEPILDVGCGDGHFASVAFDRRIDIGIDPHHASLLEAQSNDAYTFLVEANGDSLPYETDSFASALSNSVLEHIPQLDEVLAEVCRVLRPRAPFAITTPNPGYSDELGISSALASVGLRGLGNRYRNWFETMSRTVHMYTEDEWEEKLAKAGMSLESSFRYFSPAALRMLEWGHYFGAPSLVSRWFTGRWILVPSRWNLSLTEGVVRKFYEEEVGEQGTYTFLLARKI